MLPIKVWAYIVVTMVFHGLGILTDMKWIACAIGVSLAIIAMMVTGTVHPPGGATALTCALSGFCTFDYVIRPIMLGIIIMMIVATIANDIKVCSRNTTIVPIRVGRGHPLPIMF